MKSTLCKVSAALLVALPATPAGAWHDEGHHYAAVAATEALPDDVPAFFRDGAATVAHCAADPDVAKHPQTEPLRRSEHPEHFLDLELLSGWMPSLPETRAEFLAAAAEHGKDPERIGLLPYAIIEWTQRLTLAFAEHRRWPDNPHVKMKCLVYAGILSHYTADLAMPLHTSVHWDGRAERIAGDGSAAVTWGDSSRSGIHHKVDALPTKLPFEKIFAEPIAAPAPSGDVFALIIGDLVASNGRVDDTYDLEPRLPAVGDMRLDDPEVVAFGIERTRAAAEITANVLLSAWRNSADIELPFWIDREMLDEKLDRAQVPAQPKRPAR